MPRSCPWKSAPYAHQDVFCVSHAIRAASRPSKVWHHAHNAVTPVSVPMQEDSSGSSKPARTVEYDIVGAPNADFSFAVTFPFHPSPSGDQVTIIREYSQGANAILYNLPTGTRPHTRHLVSLTLLRIASCSGIVGALVLIGHYSSHVEH